MFVKIYDAAVPLADCFALFLQIISLLLGYLIAGLATYKGNTYVSTANIKASPGGTFLWVKTFNIR